MGTTFFPDEGVSLDPRGGALPPSSDVGAIVYDPGLATLVRWNGAAWVPLAGAGGGGLLLTEEQTVLVADATTNTQPPVYTPLVSVNITKTEAASTLSVFYASTWIYSGGGGRVDASFRFLLDGVPIAGPGGYGVVDNSRDQTIAQPVAFMRTGIPAAAGAHIFAVEWAYFGVAGRTLAILAFSRPDINSAALIAQEVA